MRKKRLKKIDNNSKQTAPSNNAMQLFANELVNRMTLAYRSSNYTDIGVTHNGARDLYTILGYKKDLEYKDYAWRYERQDIATRIVQAFPLASWSINPRISESDTPTPDTEFEKKFNEITIKNKVFNYLTRLDINSGVGRYGIMILGFADGKKLDQPVKFKKGMKLSYISTFQEGSVTIDKYDNDTSSERFNLPEIYSVTIRSPEQINTTPNIKNGISSPVKVHWTRVIHVIPEMGGESDIFGTPRLKNVYNRLQDIEAIAGGGAEMFWRGAFQGLAFKNDEGATMDAAGKAQLESEIEDYVNDFKRYIKLQNMDVKPIETQVADPTNHFDIQVTLIAAAKGMPKRIILGSERGELASSQDDSNWNKRVEERRVDHCELDILRPFIDRLIEYGVLPKPSLPYKVVWPDLYSQSALDKAKVSEALMRALKDYLTMGEGQMIIPPKVFLQKIMGFSENEVKQAEDIINKMSQSEIDDILNDEDIDANRDNNAGNTDNTQ